MTQAGDVGTDIRLDTGVDLASAIVLKILYRKPSGEEGCWTATAVDDTYVKYISTEGDLDESDQWTLWAYAEFSGGKYTGRKTTVTIGEAISCN